MGPLRPKKLERVIRVKNNISTFQHGARVKENQTQHIKSVPSRATSSISRWCFNKVLGLFLPFQFGTPNPFTLLDHAKWTLYPTAHKYGCLLTAPTLLGPVYLPGSDRTCWTRDLQKRFQDWLLVLLEGAIQREAWIEGHAWETRKTMELGSYQQGFTTQSCPESTFPTTKENGSSFSCEKTHLSLFNQD